MITIAVVDDHPAIRLGLRSALRSEPGLEPVGSAASAGETDALLYRTRPDVVLLDYQLPESDGLTLCRRIKSDVPAPAVIIYSAFADPSMTVPAIVAGADGIIHKGGQTRELFDAIRRAARGDKVLPSISQPLLEAAREALEPDDLPVLGMLINRTPAADIALTLRIARAELDERIAGMLSRLKVPVPTAGGSMRPAGSGP
jgi:DNA-binding NarL/FixJ family response regulator